MYSDFHLTFNMLTFMPILKNESAILEKIFRTKLSENVSFSLYVFNNDTSFQHLPYFCSIRKVLSEKVV